LRRQTVIPMNNFADRFRSPEGSPIRALFRYLNDPAIVGFAGGNPAPDLFDADGLREAMTRAMELPATSWAQYSATEGVGSLREALASYMSEHGQPIDPASIVVTASSQQGFDLLTRVLLNPGDTVAVENPTYTTALQALKLAGASIAGIQSDHDGLDTSALEQWLMESREGSTLKALYIVPTFANPSGATLSLHRRRHLVELAVRHDFIVIEDDPYGELRFTGTALPRIVDIARDVPDGQSHVVYLSSLSKIMAPGLRLGWMVGPADILGRCVIAKQTVDLCSSTWTQAAAAIYLSQGRLPHHVKRASEVYSQRANAMTEALLAELGDAFSFQPPEGGMFIWGRFRDDVDANELLTEAIKAGVVFVPGAPFFANRPDTRTARLCFTMCSPERIREGVKRLSAALSTYKETPAALRKRHL
jgi:2-aminoadipate transaminase